MLHRYEMTRAIEPTLETLRLPSDNSTLELAWPNYGQATIATEKQGIVATNGSQTPHPTASTAKLISVMAILEKKPLQIGEYGPTITLTEADVKSYENYVAKNGSNTPVYSGLKLTQYQALQSILLASSNNMADTMTIWAFGSLENYREYASEMVRRIGATQTTIGSDASGLSPTTSSTSDDMSLISLEALKNPVIVDITSQQTANVPFAGTISNTNRLLGDHSEVIGLKTGETVEAGGNFLLATKYENNGQSQNVVVVVYGAELGRIALLDSYTLYKSIQPYLKYQEIIPENTIVARYYSKNNEIAQAVTERSVMSWTWSGKSVRPATVVERITGEAKDRSVVGSVVYGDVSTPVVLSKRR